MAFIIFMLGVFWLITEPTKVLVLGKILGIVLLIMGVLVATPISKIPSFIVDLSWLSLGSGRKCLFKEDCTTEDIGVILDKKPSLVSFAAVDARKSYDVHSSSSVLGGYIAVRKSEIITAFSSLLQGLLCLVVGVMLLL